MLPRKLLPFVVALLVLLQLPLSETQAQQTDPSSFIALQNIQPFEDGVIPHYPIAGLGASGAPTYRFLVRAQIRNDGDSAVLLTKTEVELTGGGVTRTTTSGLQRNVAAGTYA